MTAVSTGADEIDTARNVAPTSGSNSQLNSPRLFEGDFGLSQGNAPNGMSHAMVVKLLRSGCAGRVIFRANMCILGHIRVASC